MTHEFYPQPWDKRGACRLCGGRKGPPDHKPYIPPLREQVVDEIEYALLSLFEEHDPHRPDKVPALFRLCVDRSELLAVLEDARDWKLRPSPVDHHLDPAYR
jgi:hypothetical protein